MMFRHAVLSTAFMLAIGCGEASENTTEPARSSTAVAFVNGIGIEADAVRARAEETEQSARDALSELIDEELLYQVSLTQHGGEGADLSLDEKRLAVHALLRRVVEGEVSEASLDPEVVEEQSRLVAEARTVREVRVATVLSVPFGAQSRSRREAEELGRGLCGRLVAGEASGSLLSSVGSTFPEDVMVQEDQSFQAATDDPIAGLLFSLDGVGEVTSEEEVGDFVVCARLERIVEGNEVRAEAVADEVQRDYLRHQRLRRVSLLAEGAAERFGVVRFEENIGFAISLDLDANGEQ